MKFVAIIGVLLLGVSHAIAAAPPSDISFTISAAGWDKTGGYVAGRPMMVRCVFENTGKDSRQILLKDHDDYHGTLRYPTTMRATVWDSNGKALVENWTNFVLWSTIFQEMPGDQISLRPGEKVVRVIPLEAIILGPINGLRAGSYRVQLTIPEATSNTLNIVVKEEPNKAPEPTPTAVTSPAAQEPRQP